MSQPSNLPSLAILRCFEAAAKYENFSSAAEDLGMSQGAVSRHVRDFEAFVGAALFRREGRGVRLTLAGTSLAGQLSGDLDRLRQTVQQAIALGGRRKLLKIAAPPTFSSRWLVPRLEFFRAQHPGIEFMIESRSEPFDIDEARVDLAIHVGTWDWPGAQLTPLCPEDLVAVAAPALAKGISQHTPAALAGLPRLHLSGRPHLWEHLLASIGAPAEDIRSGSYFDQFSLVISAAAAGMGAAILPTYLIETELKDGRLKRLAALPAEASRTYFIATSAVPQDALTREFIDWLRRQVSRRPSL